MSMELPAYLLEGFGWSVAEDATAGLNSAMPAHISIAGNKFAAVDAGGVQKNVGGFDQKLGVYLDVVVVAANPSKSRRFYKDKFTGAEGVPPTCFSNDGVYPDASATERQSQNCAACPMAAWDTSLNDGKGGRRCSDRKRLAAIIPEHDLTTGFLLDLPPASLKAWASYVNGLAGTQVGGRKLDTNMIVTRISFASQGVLQFHGARWVNQEEVAAIRELGPKPFPQLLGITEGSGAPAIAAPPAAQALPPAQPKTEDMAPFLETPAPAPQPARKGRPPKQEKPAEAPAPMSFGMAQAAPASSEMNDALAAAFSLKL